MVNYENVSIPNTGIPHALAVNAEHIDLFRLFAVHENIRQGEGVLDILRRQHGNTGGDSTNQRHGIWFLTRAFRQIFRVDKHGALLGGISRDQSLFL